MVSDLSLGDVENVSIAAIWINIYKHLDWKEVIRARAICTALRRELPRVVQDLRLRCFASAPQRKTQLDTVAATFTQLQTLELLAPHSITPQPVESFMDWRHLVFPNLRELTVQTDVAEDIRLLPQSLPKLENLVLVAKDTNGPVSLVDIQLPTLKTLRFIAIDFLPGSIESLEASLSASSNLQVVEFAYCGISRAPYDPRCQEEGLSLYLPKCQELFFDKCHLCSGLEVEAPRLQAMRVICRDGPLSDQLTHLRLWPNRGPPGTPYDGTDGQTLRQSKRSQRLLTMEANGEAVEGPVEGAVGGAVEGRNGNGNVPGNASVERNVRGDPGHHIDQACSSNSDSIASKTPLLLPRVDLKVFTNANEPGLDADTLRHLQSHPRVSLVLYVQNADLWGDPEPWL